MKEVHRLFLAAVVTVCLLWSGNAHSQNKTRLIDVRPQIDGPTTRVYIEALTDNEADIYKFRRQLMAVGARNVNLFLPSTIVADIPDAMDKEALRGFRRNSDFSFMEPAEVESNSMVKMSESLDHARRSYAVAARIARADLPPVTDGDFQDVVRRVPADVVNRSRNLPRPMGVSSDFEPRFVDQNAEFLIGDVLMRLVLPESDGGSEDWSDDEVSKAVAGALGAMLSFQQRFNFVPIDFVFNTIARAPTSYEPIEHNMDTDDQWIMDVVKRLGVPDLKDVLLTVHHFNESGRGGAGTDWVFTAFVANSENAPGQVFNTTAYTAYANLGGPYLVMPYPAGTNNPNDIDPDLMYSQIFQHEAVHVFWGLDEYPSAPTQCSSVAGYLHYANMNKINVSPQGAIAGCPGLVPCIMGWAGREDVGRPVCFFSSGQMGVVDANQDDIPDIFSVPPSIEYENSDAETVDTEGIVINMKAISNAVLNQNSAQDPSSRISYAPPIKDATLSINGAGNIRLTPLDGKWDSIEEDLTFRLTDLLPGLTEVEVVVRNTFGATSPKFTKSVYFPGVNFALFDVDIQEKAIRVAWSTVGESFGAQMDLYRSETVSGQRVTTLLQEDVSPVSSTQLFTTYAYTDATVEPTQSYEYFVSGHFTLDIQGTSRNFETISDPIQTRAMLPISSGRMISSFAPNPFNSSTTFSVRIPKSYESSQTDPGSPGGPTGILTQVPSGLEVTVFDVLGRRVKGIFAGTLFGQVRTFTWDGTNDRNERVPSGIYFVKTGSSNGSEVRKIVLVR